MKLYNLDCIVGSEKIEDKSIDLLIADPPFGIDEVKFEQLYNRNDSNVIQGYVLAPKNYYEFTFNWLKQAKRVLKDTGTIYLISGWNNLTDVLCAVRDLDLITENHLIWKYNFGVYNKNKFISSHYHMLKLHKKGFKPKFNQYCRFGNLEKDNEGKSLNYLDREDVFIINKEFQQGEIKNQNKLPDELIKKLILYSSDENDLVCDFFMGNFTTAYVAYGLNREVVGFELNKNSFDYHSDKLSKLVKGFNINELKNVIVDLPKNAGKSISEEERNNIINEAQKLYEENMLKKDIIEFLSKKYNRGKFSIINILKNEN